MKVSRSRLVFIFLTVSFLAACNLPLAGVPSPDTNAIATRVQATLLSLTQQAPQSSPVANTPLKPQFTPPAKSSSTPQPTITPFASASPTLLASLTPKPGSIAGNISGYPYGSVPRLAIVAFDQHTSYLMYWYWITGSGQTSYSMDNYIPPSTYQVVAYDGSGHAGGCTSLVVVTSDQTANCDITDWSGSYPSKPSKVPAP